MTLRTACFFFLFCAPWFAAAQESPYFPVAGKGAREQTILDLKSQAVVLSIAAEPGQEDLWALADMRLNAGARVFSAYATNGGATPSDLSGELPNDVAGRRKEEAYHALTLIGGDAYFLNFPDVGIVESPAALEQLWQRDTVRARCVRMLRSIRPDLLLLARDARIDEGDSVRWEVMCKFVLEAVAAAADASVLPKAEGGPWRVRRIVAEGPGTLAAYRTARDRIHPVWKRTAGQIAEEAGRRYVSLRVQYANRQHGVRPYALLTQPLRKGATGLLDGLPALTRTLGAIRPEVIRACDNARAGKVEESLLAIVRAGRAIEQAVSPPQKGITALDRRVLGRWKAGLEDLRCQLLGVTFPYAATDSILATSQLMFLRVPSMARPPAVRGAEIMFPAALQAEWVINETEKYRFPFALPAEFRILSPEMMQTTMPPSLGGLEATAMREKFPFIIFHRDSVSTRDYAFQREIRLRISPPQSVEILTPVVRITRGERLVVRLQNASRDAWRGTMSIGDSVVQPLHLPVSLDKRNAFVLDTLALSWTEGLPDGDHLADLHIGKGRAVARFLARKFEAAADTSMTVGLFSGIEASPVEDALRRLQIPCVLLDSAGVAGESLDRLRRVVIDRNALLLRSDAPFVASRLARWVAAGGHLVMLSQAGDPPGVGVLTGEIGFLQGTLRSPAAPVTADTASTVSTVPNRLRDADWQDWAIARARGTVRGKPGASQVVHVLDGVSGAPLVASATVGNGIITAVALDLLPQFQTVQVGAYRLFANLLAY